MCRTELALHICRFVETTTKPTTPTKALADWLMSAVWLFGPEFGDVVLQERLRWIKSSSLELAATGLQMDEFFPADNWEELDAILVAVELLDPSLKDDCDSIRRSFRQQFGYK